MKYRCCFCRSFETDFKIALKAHMDSAHDLDYYEYVMGTKILIEDK